MRCLLAASLVLSPFSTLAAQAAISNTAQVSASTPRGATVDSLPSSEIVTTLVPSPALTLIKSATLNDLDAIPGISAGDTITYEVTAQNTGNVSLSGIIVDDPLIALTFDASSDANSDSRIDTTETWRWTGTYNVTQADIDTNGGGDGLIENTVTLSSDQLADEIANADVPVVRNPQAEIEKLADASTANVPGDLITYTVTATNTGNTTLTNMVVSDPLLTPDTITCLTVLPGGTCVLSGSYTVQSADFLAGGVTNTASVVTNETPEIDTSITTPIVLGAGIEVVKSANPTTINNPGETITYSVVVTNVGNVPVANITVIDPMVALDCGSGSNTIASLPFGGSVTCTGDYVVTQADFDAGTTLVNTATATDDGTFGVGDSDSATVTLVASPSMLVTKTGVLNDDDGVGGVSETDTILYTITVENTGNVPLTNVVPNDPMVTLTYVSGDTDSDTLLDANEIWTFTGSYPLTQADIDGNGGGDGTIENTVTVSSDETGDETADAITPLDINPSMDVVKTGVLNDDDGNPGQTAGDTIDYTVTVTNTGNIRLTGIIVTDPLVTLNYQSGDTNGDNRLDVNEVWTFTGTTILTQGDIDTLGGGDGDIDNTVTVSTDQLPDQDASHELPIAPVSSMEITKTTTPAVRIFPTIYEYDYRIAVRNVGAITQTGIRVEDDLVAGVAPATLIGSPSVVISGFSGTGGYNSGFDGAADPQLLTGDVQLAPGAIALITITVRIDTGARTIESLNSAFLSSDLITTPIPSDDPGLTPGDSTDINPTPFELIDSDGDGSPDYIEDMEPDRDGDGVPNANDYDPTGYFYCQADGRILSGGLITVENLTSGGSQTGLGTSSGITVIRDGSDGLYQFYVSQEGNYRLTYVLPSSGVASTTLLSSGSLDVSTLLPDDPGVIGSGEFGSTGFLADAAPAANPFYTRFEIQAGDPPVFNNNIPLQFCGSPALTADKSIEAGPDLQPDLRQQVTYRLDVTASGDEPVTNVQMVDNLANVFGAGNYTIENLVIDSAPAGFTAVPDPFYDGNANTALLTSGGTLQPGEAISMLLTVNVSVVDGIYTNTLIANGASPLDGSSLPPSMDDARIEITNAIEGLVIQKTALPGSARIGDPVRYTITVTNNSGVDITGADIVDRIPNGMSYLPNSARVAGVPVEPTGSALDGSGRDLVWTNVPVPNDGNVVITLVLMINASGSSDEYVNTAFVRDPGTGSVISNIAKAVVRSEIDPVFQCSDVIGRVFDDLDRDGYADDGEPGLPGVRLATPNGLLVTTDKFGRYSIACGMIPDGDIGSNFIMKLDTRTLPTGYRVTSENPRVVRLTRGKMAKLNFGAANLRVVRLEVTDASFLAQGGKATPATLRSIGGLLSVLDEEPSVLRIVYSKPAVGREVARERLQALEQLVRDAWQRRNSTHELSTETRLVE